MNIVSGTRAGALLFSSLGLQAGDPFIISAGSTVILDIDTPSLGYTDINGLLKTDGGARTLTTTGIGVHNGGTLQLGTESVPLVALTKISLTGAYVPLTNTVINGFTTPTNPGISRAIMVDSGGTIDMHGTPPNVLWTTINADAAAGANSLTLATSPGWLSGDPVIVAMTDFNDTAGGSYGGQTEQFLLSSNTSGTTASLNGTLAASRWGKLQYPVDVLVSGNGMSLTQNTFSAKKAHANVPIVLDQRARVANLARNIVVTCPNDTDYSVKGHGAVIMWMTGSIARLDGVQIKQGGQAGALGRYPFHSHMWSWNVAGTFLGNASLNYVKRCAVWGSTNRAYTCHGTTGMEWSDNFGFDIAGHAMFLEDGSESGNKFYRNQMYKIREPAGGHNYVVGGNISNVYLRGSTIPGSFVSMSGDGTTTTVNWTSHGLYSGQLISVSSSSIAGYNVLRCPVTVISANQFTYPSSGSGTPTGMVWRKDNLQLKAHDASASGFWITNMGNDFQDNYASDANGGDPVNLGFGSNGFWISIHNACLGLSANVPVNPNAVNVGTLKGCVSHSNRDRGIMLAFATGDELGSVGSAGVGKYTPSNPILSTDHILWKNANGAYLNSVGVPDYQRWTTADNAEQDFFGSTNEGGLAHQMLVIGLSLNSANAQPATAFYPRACFTPYHGTVRFFDMTAVNFAYAPVLIGYVGDRGRGGGVSQGGTDSYDVPGIDEYTGQNTNIQLINAHYGPQAVPLHLNGHGNLASPNNYAIAGVYHDTEGKFGPAGWFNLPITPATGFVDDYFLVGAATVQDGPVSGTVSCRTTPTRFVGMGNAASMIMHSDQIDAQTDYRWTPITVTRQNPSTGATIGTPYPIYKGDGVQGLSNFRAWPMQVGGRFQIDFSDGTNTLAPPTSYQYLFISNANVAGDNVVLGLPWSGAVVPRIAFGSHMSNESATVASDAGNFTFNTFPSAADVTAGRAIKPTTSGTLAQVVADTTGNTYFRDTANNRVWIHYAGGGFTANIDPLSGGQHLIYDIQYVVIKA